MVEKTGVIRHFFLLSSFLSSFSVSYSLAGPLTDASEASVLSQSKAVEHVRSLLVLSVGLFALAKKLKDAAFSTQLQKSRIFFPRASLGTTGHSVRDYGLKHFSSVFTYCLLHLSGKS